jgi:tetratricopeptide (TPR) repeat protein
LLPHVLYFPFILLFLVRLLPLGPDPFTRNHFEKARLDLSAWDRSRAILITATDSDGSEAAQPTDSPMLAPKLQNELGKALEALRANKPSEALSHLEVVYRRAPQDADVNFFLGIYSAEMNDWAQAKSYWEKVLVLQANHVGALLSLGGILMRENKFAEAALYLNRAIETEPTAWRAHAVLADACLRRGLLEESIHQAERALELGHGEAGIIQPLLARALESHGDKERAIEVLRAYLRDHLNDGGVRKQLEDLQTSVEAGRASDLSPDENARSPWIEGTLATSFFLPSNWFPPGIDESVPEVDSGVPCDLKEIIQRSGERIMEFVDSVDRFAATETVTHESINKWGVAARPIGFRFDYLVSIKEVRLGVLSVEEFRGPGPSLAKFPDGIATLGLPALVLIFHPYHAGNFEMSCEGQARWNGGPVWQVYFRQRNDRPKTIRGYKLGLEGPSYPVALKGRAWIASDSYQIVRLETELAVPLPEIRLVAEHTAIEYGPVQFRGGRNMWLPQTAEIHYHWKGRRTHRRHSFSNYLLFSVDDKQHISAPKAEGSGPISFLGVGPDQIRGQSGR